MLSFSQREIKSLRFDDSRGLEFCHSYGNEVALLSHTEDIDGSPPRIAVVEKLGGLLQIRVARESAQEVKETTRITCSQ